MDKNVRLRHDNLSKSNKKSLGFKQIIPGRYPSAAFIKVLPRVLESPKSRNVHLRQGIPDARCEYMILKDVCGMSRKENIPFQMTCNNVRITEDLWAEYGVELEQGIPDPYRFEGIIQCEECYRRIERIDEESGERASAEESLTSPGVNRKKGKSKKKGISDEELGERGKKSKKELKIPGNQDFEDKLGKMEPKPIKRACYSQKLYPLLNTNARSPQQSRISRMVKGIVQKCKNRMKSMSSSPSDYFDVNFVCHRCKCRYFRICAITRCSKPEKILRTIPPDSSEDSQENFSPNVSREPSERKIQRNLSKHSKANNESPGRDKNREKSKDKGDKKTDKKTHRKTKKNVGASRENYVESANDVTLEDSFSLANSNSSTSNSVGKKIERNSLPPREISRSSSRASSERLKKYIYDVFPQKFEDHPAKNHFDTKTEGFVIEDVKNFNDNSEDLSLRSKSSETDEHNRPLRLEEIFDDEDSSENKRAEVLTRHDPQFFNKNQQFVVQGVLPQGNKEITYVPAFVNCAGKFGFVDGNQIDDSGNMEILYRGYLVGALDEITNLNEITDDLIIESFREHVSLDGK
uniref:Uncharacterized protein n=1 Tax=Bracon brevicornis TaxID=1563983 RepID=A0A6V7IDI9_9HYME